MRKKVQVQKIVEHSVKTMFKRAATNGAHSDLVGWSKKNRKVLSKEATYYERVVKNFLERRGAICVPQAPFFFQELNKMCFADIYVPEGKFIIEVDGGYHNTPEQAASDKLRDACFSKRGYNVIRIKNSEAKKDILKERLAPVLASAKPFKQIKAELRAERDAKKVRRREARLNRERELKASQSVSNVPTSVQGFSETKSTPESPNCAYIVGGLHQCGIASYSVFIPKTKAYPAFEYSEMITAHNITSARAELMGILCAVRHLPKGEVAQIYTPNETIAAVLGGRWKAHSHLDIIDELRKLWWGGLSVRLMDKHWMLRSHPELATLRSIEKKKYRDSLQVGRLPGCEGLPLTPKGHSVYDALLDDGLPF